jgi:hypothetical protein
VEEASVILAEKRSCYFRHPKRDRNDQQPEKNKKGKNISYYRQQGKT